MKRGGGKKPRGKKGQQRLAAMPRVGATLKSPFARLPFVTLSSWRDERLPEMLWAALVAVSAERDTYLEVYREISQQCRKLVSDQWQGLGHTNLAKISEDDFDLLIKPLADRGLLAALTPLRLFPNLPDAKHWSRHVGNWEDREMQDYEVVALAIGATSWHQSEAATDIRWLRVLSMVLGGKMHFTENTKEQAEEIIGYPNVGDMRSVRPSIRAAEQSFGSLSMADDTPLPMDWVKEFWTQSKRETGCLRIAPKPPTRANLDGLFDHIVDVYRAVAAHFHEQDSFKAVDARLDGAFGLCIYSLNLMLNLIAGNSYRRVEGRHILRSMCECHITLAYLLKVDAERTWLQYRNYGQGQAKLAYLKSIDLDNYQKPKYFSEPDLEELANEDKWEEFLDIDLKSWASMNLREMSDVAGVKPLYDKYFPWPSGYVHGHWSAVRDTVFDQCVNPLHRLHRIPAGPRSNMNDCAEDGVKILNQTLDLLNMAYPSFKARLKYPDQSKR